MKVIRCRCGGITAIVHPDGRTEGLVHDCARTQPIQLRVAQHRSLLDRLS